jgi:hypothetical protein
MTITNMRGGTVVTDFSTSYTASLTGTLQVTFTVLDGTSPVAGASIELGSYGTMTTDASGMATFTGLIPENDIFYTVMLAGYDDVNDSISVINGDVTEEVQLITTGIGELANAQINVYPNPAVGILSIKQATSNKISSVELYNLHGQKVLEKAFLENKELVELNIREFEQGSYILKCNMHDNKVFSKKIIKKRGY